MKRQTWCYHCQRYFDRETFGDHKKLHDRERNIDATTRIQYTGQHKKGFFKGKTDEDDYLICILHQKKVPCPVVGCHYKPFGMIRKSYMMKCAKGILLEWIEEKVTKQKKTFPFFPHESGENGIIPIDMQNKTVTIMGVPIRLKI